MDKCPECMAFLKNKHACMCGWKGTDALAPNMQCILCEKPIEMGAHKMCWDHYESQIGRKLHKEHYPEFLHLPEDGE